MRLDYKGMIERFLSDFQSNLCSFRRLRVHGYGHWRRAFSASAGQKNSLVRRVSARRSRQIGQDGLVITMFDYFRMIGSTGST